jgi:23S rRNA pseudouridine2605 synthase
VINVEGLRPASGAKVYLMLNKPRGLVTTASDEKSRPTVFECFKNTALPRVVPVGRLDMASEGLLLFTNDTRWADHLLDPASCVERVYHVQVEPLPAPDLCQRLTEAIKALDEDRLAARSARVLRTGVRTGWLDIVLDEGKNREIRRLLKACGENVRRLVRVAFGPLRLGNLPNGAWRELTAVELEAVNGALASRGRWPGRARDESRAGRPDPSGPGPARP